MPWYKMYYRVKLRGILVIEAESAEEARRIATEGPMWDRDFINGAETTDWEVESEPKDMASSRD